ncbi:MAG: aminotransferase class I/II-fold pyridoxal phosphate-dependent enzyme [Proteobacteria bacterium]|nr:aminotransferase class I/II-fold pyridoxal phosphate-dependent enzyme [Pseudomonadota bacterium]
MNTRHDPFVFSEASIDKEQLRKTAFNLRWATVDADVIPLTAGEMDFPVSPEIIEAISRHARNGYLGYLPDLGLPSFREAVSENLIQNGVQAHPDQILATDGAASALRIACNAVLSPGDEVITFDPIDFLLPHCSKMAGATVIRCPLEKGTGRLIPNSMDQFVSAKTKAILICNPHNPTGRVLRKSELLEIAEFAERHHLVIINDEVWSDIILGSNPMIHLSSLSEEISQRTITISGFSKSYGISGLRIGYIHCQNVELFKNIIESSDVKSTTAGASVLSQVAAEAALLNCTEWLASFRSHLKEIAEVGSKRLSDIPGFSCPVPEGTFLLFPDISNTEYDEENLSQDLLNMAKISVVPGAERWFGPGAKGHIRLSIATSMETFNEALSRIELFFNHDN